MRMFLTRESTILPNAAPMITPTARSTTFPRKANFLNSSNMPIPPGRCCYPLNAWVASYEKVRRCDSCVKGGDLSHARIAHPSGGDQPVPDEQHHHSAD